MSTRIMTRCNGSACGRSPPARTLMTSRFGEHRLTAGKEPSGRDFGFGERVAGSKSLIRLIGNKIRDPQLEPLPVGAAQGAIQDRNASSRRASPHLRSQGLHCPAHQRNRLAAGKGGAPGASYRGIDPARLPAQAPAGERSGSPVEREGGTRREIDPSLETARLNAETAKALPSSRRGRTASPRQVATDFRFGVDPDERGVILN
jgi:hypothetical protein